MAESQQQTSISEGHRYPTRGKKKHHQSKSLGAQPCGDEPALVTAMLPVNNTNSATDVVDMYLPSIQGKNHSDFPSDSSDDDYDDVPVESLPADVIPPSEPIPTSDGTPASSNSIIAEVLRHMEARESRHERRELAQNVEHRKPPVEDHERKLDRVARFLTKMEIGENMFTVIARFERVMVHKSIPKYDWVLMFEKVLRGKWLEHYEQKVNYCIGSWDTLKSVMLEFAGYGFHECLDHFNDKFPHSNPQGAAHWVNVDTFRKYTALKAMKATSIFPDDTIRTFAELMSSISALSSVSREGRVYIVKGY